VRWLKTLNQTRTIPNFNCVPVQQEPRAASRVFIVAAVWKVEVVDDVAVVSNLKQPVGMLLHRSSPK
jgi:hypothetical protein